MNVPDKIFYKIGDVSQLVGVKPYVLRYWENEFSFTLRKSRSGQRLYRRADIERLLLIKKLLYAEGFTIAGAKKYLSRQRSVAAGGNELFSEAQTIRAGQEKPETLLTERVVSEAASSNRDTEVVVGASDEEDSSWIEAVREEIEGLQVLIRSVRDYRP